MSLEIRLVYPSLRSVEILIGSLVHLTFAVVFQKIYNIMARIFKVTVLLSLFLHNIYCDEMLRMPQDEDQTTEDIEEPIQATKSNLITINLSECTCTGVSTCDLTILKTPLMDITCGDGESLCCPMTKSTDLSTSSAVDSNNSKSEEAVAEVAPKSNVRVYAITPSFWKDLDLSSPSKKSVKSKNKCVCKARSSCPHKYIDYGFGFHCTYSTVRCCIPEEENNNETSSVTLVESYQVEQQPDASPNVTEIEAERDEQPEFTLPADMDAKDPDMNIDSTHVDAVELPMTTLMVDDEELQVFNEGADPVENIENETMAVMVENVTSADINEEPPRQEQNEQGELVITEVTNWNGDAEDEYEKEADCYCLPIQKCRVEGGNDFNNMIERRRDTFCPGDLVQCCGRHVIEEITKKRDDVAGEYDVTSPMKLDIPDSEPQQMNQFPSPSDILPTTNETDFDTAPAPTSLQEAINSSVLTPPFQGYQPPGYYKGYQNPQSTKSYPSQQEMQIGQTYGVENQHPSQYVPNGGQNVSPWMYSNYAPQQVKNGQHYDASGYPARVPYSEETARHKPGGLFDSLVKLWG